VKPDSGLREDVQEELGWEPSVDERRIGVAVSDAVVTLTGEFGRSLRTGTPWCPQTVLPRKWRTPGSGSQVREALGTMA
jgi:hypothetical protein